MVASTNVAYDLPAILKAVQSGWTYSSQSAATVSTLIVLLDAQFLTFLKGQSPFAHKDLLLAFVYGGFLLNIGAMISSLVITELFGEMPLNAARSDPETVRDTGRFSIDTIGLLKRYGARRGLRWITWHWFLSLFLGIVCSIISVMMYVWITEPLAIRIVMTVISIFSVLPLLHYMVPE